MGRSIIWCVVVLSLVLAACTTSTSTQGPTTWVDQPLDGARLPLGPQEITAHASDSDGVVSFEFYVDGTLLVSAPARIIAPVDLYTNSYVGSGASGYLADATVGWNPSRPGVYTVSVTATDVQGNVGPEARAVVMVGVLLSPSPPTPSAELTPAEPPTGTPRPSETVPPPPTSTAVPPTTTPLPPTITPLPPSPTAAPPPTIVSLQANPTQIQEGACTTISWRVEGSPTSIYFDGEGVTSPDSRDRCPSETTSYTLTARGPGGEVSQNVTVSVIVDTAGPNIDNVQQSGNAAYCLTDPREIEITARVRDPSGVGSVELYCALDGGGEEWCGGFSRSGNNWSVTYIPLEHAICSGTMQYRIRATDNSARDNVSWWGTGSFGIADY